MRESPALRLIELLQQHGAEVSYHDPYVPELPPTRRYRFPMRSEPLTPETLGAVDAVIVVTAHKEVDHAVLGGPRLAGRRHAQRDGLGRRAEGPYRPRLSAGRRKEKAPAGVPAGAFRAIGIEA